MFVCCECCVLSGSGVCDELNTRPEESYRLWRVVVCDQETSKTWRLKPATGLWEIQPQWLVTPGKQTDAVHATKEVRSCDCSVGLVQRLRAGRSGFRIPTDSKICSFLEIVQICSGAPAASYSVCKGVRYRVNAAGA
jgi:hypothetical protein